MITSFKCKETEKLYGGVCPIKFRAIRDQAERKLTPIDASETFEFLALPPGNRLENLSGNRRGQWIMRINQQWRLCFTFANGNASKAEIVD